MPSIVIKDLYVVVISSHLLDRIEADNPVDMF